MAVSVSHLNEYWLGQTRIDRTSDMSFTNLSFPFRAPGQGTVYFKSQRKHKAGRFETANFTLFVDGNPTPIDLMHTDLLQLGN